MLRRILMGSVALIAMFAVAGSALFFAGPSSAQVDDGAAGETAEFAREGRGDREGRKGNRGVLTGEEKAAVVADALGISVEDVMAAYEDGVRMSELAEATGVDVEVVVNALYDASVEKVNQMVADGEMTQERADEILAKMELRQLAATIIDKDVLKQAAADTLGISVEEMAAAKEAGTLQEIAEEAGVSREDIKAAVEAARNEMIDQAEANGDITAEQAEQLREMSLRGKGKGGRGHGKGQGRPNPAVEDTTDA